MYKLTAIFATICGLAVFGYLIDNHLSTPVVQITYPGKQCVQVKYGRGEFTCDNLPEKYIIQRVSPRQ